MYISKTKTPQASWLTVAVMLLAVILPIMSYAHASAASLSQVFVRFDSMTASSQSTGTVCAKPTTAATEASVQVVFPTGYSVGASTDFTVTTTNLAWPSGGTAWPGINTATNVTGQTVTFPSTDLTVGTLYCFNWDDGAAMQISPAASASNIGSVTTRDSGPATIDTASYATASITDDQIVVTATVPPAFSFALSGNSDALGTLSSSSVSSSPTPRTATVNTNAKNGWTVWAKDLNAGLASPTAGATIASTTPGTNSTLSAGSEGYNTGVTSSQASGSGTITVATPFIGGAFKGGGLDTTMRSLATSNGTASNAVLTLTNNVSIAGSTLAANDYSDTITVVGAGLF